MRDSFTVRDLPPAERPRERLIQLGAEALSAQEILALILGRGVKGESVMVTAQKLLPDRLLHFDLVAPCGSRSG